MTNSLLSLIKTKLELIEKCKLDSFHTMMIYSESLPSLLVQCIGYIEDNVCNKKSYDEWHLYAKQLSMLSNTWYENIDVSLLDKYQKILDDISSDSIAQEFRVAVDLLKSKESLHKDKFFKYLTKSLNLFRKYRDDFAHGKINSRRLSIISKQDFYVYFGVLLLIDKCIDDIINNCE